MGTGRRILLASCVLGLFVAVASGINLRGGRTNVLPPLSSSSPATPAATRETYDPTLADKTIVFWKAAAARDAQGFLERKNLAGAYLARFRERGDIADAVRAEEAARESLKILERGNVDASTRLARALVAQHRFPEALKYARAAQALDPQAGRLVADVLIELGDYDEAAVVLKGSEPDPGDLNYYAVRARLELIDGHPDTALRLLQEARKIAEARLDMPAENVAWVLGLIGHLQVESGKLEDGERSCLAALEVFPGDYRAMTSLAAAASWRKDYRKAVSWGEKALKACPQNPEAVRIVGDAYASLEHTSEAARYHDMLKVLAHSFPRIYDRHWAMACASRGEDLDEALALARKDLELRHDVHAYDTLAWVSFQRDDLGTARDAMAKALARGTQEAPLLYHAGMIARASGDVAGALAHFNRARGINPRSVPLRWVRWMESQPG